jgi:hypothetical protein
MFKTIKKLINKIFKRKVIVANNIPSDWFKQWGEAFADNVEKKIIVASEKLKNRNIELPKRYIPTNHDDLVGCVVDNEIKKIEQRKTTKEQINELTRYAESVIKDIETKNVEPVKHVDRR